MLPSLSLFSLVLLVLVALTPPRTAAYQPCPTTTTSRRAWFRHVSGAALVATTSAPVHAAPVDCMEDCLANCRRIAPQDPVYCRENCRDYCAQPDRTDGLSGSVSSESGEVGILGGTFGQGTVVQGQDKPPAVQLPGLDFSSPAGRKLLGY